MNEHDPILAPDDPLQSLLDEALQPVAPPPDLAGRIVAATRPQLAARRRPVLMRIGPVRRAAMALAAMIALAIGLTITLRQQDSTTHPTNNTTVVGTLDVETELAQLAMLPVALDSTIDREMDLLRLRIDLAAAVDADDLTPDPLRESILEWESSLYTPDTLF